LGLFQGDGREAILLNNRVFLLLAGIERLFLVFPYFTGWRILLCRDSKGRVVEEIPSDCSLRAAFNNSLLLLKKPEKYAKTL
jgi:hypothetical protein